MNNHELISLCTQLSYNYSESNTTAYSGSPTQRNINRLSNTFKKFYGRHTDLVGQYKKNVCEMFADCTSQNDSFFPDLSKLN